ncbi:MAG: hypothetical protein K2O05_00330, partial [Anaeroplasmataceae bacterium]|nr:hypothetical protein [Anaeroplasmataceae bacterium]
MKFKNSNITYAGHTYIDFENDAGLASINVGFKEVIFRHQDIEMGEGNFKMGISHIYSNTCHIGESYVGNNWKLNIEQYVIPYHTSYNLEGFKEGDYIYIDQDGYIHKFSNFDTNRYVDSMGSGMVLTVNSDSYQIKDSSDNELLFNSNGALTKMTAVGNPKTIVKRII